MDEWKRSGQIPAFGDWDRANELPITQYFECARQAGLIRFSNSSGDCDKYMRGDLYSPDFNKPNSLHHNNYNNLAPPPRKARVLKEKKGVEPQVKEQKRQLQRKVCDVIEPQRKHHHHRHQQNYYMSHDANNTASVIPHPPRNPKPVDEDLYKIPPELLRNSKRKKIPGFLSCLVPACAS